MKSVSVSDMSLVLAESDGKSLSFKEKMEIVKRLNDLAVDVIEVSPVKGDKAEDVLIKTLSSCINKSVISCRTGKDPESMKKDFALISGAKKKRLNVCVPVSSVQMEYVLGKKPKAVQELIVSLTEQAAALCGDVEVSLLDATRAEPEFLYSAISSAISCGAKTISLMDFTGSMMPSEFTEFLEKVRAAVPELNSVKLNIGVSDAFSMGTATAVSSVLCGVDGVKVSAYRTDAAISLDKFVYASEAVAVKKGYSLNVNRTAIGRTVNAIAELVGDKADLSGEERFSDEKTEDIEKSVTQSALSKIIKRRGYDLSAEDLKKVYSEFLRLSEKKTVNTKELDVIIATSAMQVPETYSLISFSVNSSNVVAATASVVLSKNSKKMSGLSFGNGPVDAAFLAIESVVGRHFELDDFELGAVTEGKEALGQAIVKLRLNGSIYSGRGVSTDIIGASIRAYVNAINKAVYLEVNG